MKLLEILGVHENSFENDDKLFEQIKKSYKKEALKYHPDRANGNLARFQMINAINEVLSDPKYLKYYVAQHAQLDPYFQEDKYEDFLKTYIKGAVVDTDKVNLDTARYIYSEQLQHFTFTQSGLNQIQLAIDAAKNSNTNNPYYPPIQHLSHEAKAQYLIFVEGRKEEMDMVIERARKVFSSQNIQHDQHGFNRISDLMNQLQRNDHTNVPKDLLKEVDEARQQNYIAAYYDVLSSNKNNVEFLKHKAHSVVSRQAYEYSQRGIASLDNLITQINQGNYAGVPQELFLDVDESAKTSLIRAYLECLIQNRAQISFVCQRAEEVVNQQNFRCDQKSLIAITNVIAQINQGNSSGFPPQLFADVNDSLRAPLKSAYFDCLIRYKNYIEFVFNKAQDVINHQNFRYDQHSLNIINQQITEVSQGNCNNIPQELFLNVNENSKDNLVYAYSSILHQYRDQIAPRLLEENQRRLETLRQVQEEQRRRNAEVLINSYVKRINELPVAILDTTNIGIIRQQRTILLQQLTAITQGQQDLVEAINVLHANGQIANAINTKTNEINLVAQKAEEIVRRREEQNLLAERRKQEELNRKQEEERQLLKKQQGIAEVVINSYVKQINEFPVMIVDTTNIEIIRRQRTVLLQQLTAITQDQQDLAEAINVLQDNGQIINAIDRKTNEINFAAQKAEGILRLREEQNLLAERRKQEELNRKKEEERQNLEEQHAIAEVVINIYVEQINEFPVSIVETTSIEVIRQQRTELLQQLTAITKDQPDLAEAINVLHANGQSPKITNAINAKKEEINLAAKEAEKTLRLHEEQKLLAEQRKQEELNRKQEDERQRLVEQRRNKEMLKIKDEAPKIAETITKKTQAINTTSQEPEVKIEAQRLDTLNRDQKEPRLDAPRKAKEQQRERLIRLEEKRINDILNNLAQRIGGITQHHFDEARDTAENLLNVLQKAKIDYLNSLDNLDISPEGANEDFKQTCKALIDGSRSVLERDLDWGSYLTNLCKMLGNAIILVTTFGQVNNFFKQERAESIKAVEAAELQLKPAATVGV